MKTIQDLAAHLTENDGITGLRMGNEFRVDANWVVKIIGFNREWDSLDLQWIRRRRNERPKHSGDEGSDVCRLGEV